MRSKRTKDFFFRSRVSSTFTSMARCLVDFLESESTMLSESCSPFSCTQMCSSSTIRSTPFVSVFSRRRLNTPNISPDTTSLRYSSGFFSDFFCSLSFSIACTSRKTSRADFQLAFLPGPRCPSECIS